jgi:hypothetical protein
VSPPRRLTEERSLPQDVLGKEGRSGLRTSLLLSGPSGAGKTTIARRLLARHGGPGVSLVRSVSVTTRPRRLGEVDGEDYLFVTERGFASLRSAVGLLEHSELYGSHYGTPRSFVEQRVSRGSDVLLVLDAHARRQFAASHGASFAHRPCYQFQRVGGLADMACSPIAGGPSSRLNCLPE